MGGVKIKRAPIGYFCEVIACYAASYASYAVYVGYSPMGCDDEVLYIISKPFSSEELELTKKGGIHNPSPF